MDAYTIASKMTWSAGTVGDEYFQGEIGKITQHSRIELPSSFSIFPPPSSRLPLTYVSITIHFPFNILAVYSTVPKDPRLEVIDTVTNSLEQHSYRT